jgi:peptidoglycan LD-endopeptidase LytH
MFVKEIQRCGYPVNSGTIDVKRPRMNKKILHRSLLAGFFVTVLSCGPLTKISDTFTNPSAREIYVRELDDEAQKIQWQADYKNAVEHGVTVSLPYGEKGVFADSQNVARSYTVNLVEGEVLTAAVATNSAQSQVFLDVYQWDGDEFRLLASADEHANSLDFPAQDTGTYKLVIQPEINADAPFFLNIGKKPLYRFPVAGKGNSAVGSFWADVRDGGKRSHEGIDIFAKRGTPVVAATDGVIGFTGERGIGGKQVWLTTGLFGKSLYYAHLDRISVSSGQSVKSGDTLGFVGNTGNAKTTTPHLHFGIYTGHGAVDPLPFVYQTDAIRAANYPKHFSKTVIMTSKKLNLRSGPSTNFAASTQLDPKQILVLLGQHKDWLHVRTASGQTGFINRKYAKPV